MLSLNLLMQCCVSGIHWYLMVKGRRGGRKENSKTTARAPEQHSLFHGQAFMLYVLCYFAVIYLCCLRCPAVEKDQTQLRHSWLVL